MILIELFAHTILELGSPLALSLQRADEATLEQVGLIGPNVSEDARLRIVFSDGKSLIFKPRKRFYGDTPDAFEVQLVLDIDLTDAGLVDEILFGLRNRNLDEILQIIDRDAYKRLCIIYLDGHEWSENVARDYVPAVGKQLFAWSSSLMYDGGSGTTLRPGLEVEQILVGRAAD